MRILNHQNRCGDARTQAGRLCTPRKLSRNGICVFTDFAHSALWGVLVSLSSLLVCAIPCHASDASYNSATISGLGARNIGSAAMSGRISAMAGTREPSGKITLFVGSASGGVWKSDDSGTRFRPIFDEQPVQSIGAIALDSKNSKNVWVGTGESWTRNSVSIGD